MSILPAPLTHTHALLPGDRVILRHENAVVDLVVVHGVNETLLLQDLLAQGLDFAGVRDCLVTLLPLNCFDFG